MAVADADMSVILCNLDPVSLAMEDSGNTKCRHFNAGHSCISGKDKGQTVTRSYAA